MINISRARPDQSSEVNEKLLLRVLKYHPDTGRFTLRYGYRMGGVQLSPKAGDRVGKEDEMGIRHIRLFAIRYPEHTLAWFYAHGAWPRNGLRHLDGDLSNNRIENLEEIIKQK